MFGKPLETSSNIKKSDVDAVNASNYLVRAESWIVLHPEVLHMNNAENEGHSSFFSSNSLNTLTTQSGDSGEDSSRFFSQDPCPSLNSSGIASTSGTLDSSRWGTASEDCFSIDVNRKPPLRPYLSPRSKEGRNFNCMNPHNDPKGQQGSSPDRSVASDLPLGSNSNGISPLTSPPVQIMQQVETLHDPHRIPASVFARGDSLTPGEWSAASGDSLFSIQLGDNTLKPIPSWKTGEKLNQSPNLSGESTFDLSDSPSPEDGQHRDTGFADKTGLKEGALEVNYKKKKTRVRIMGDRDEVRLIPTSLPSESKSSDHVPIQKSKRQCCGICNWLGCTASCWSCSWLCCWKSCPNDTSRVSSTETNSNSHAKAENTSCSQNLDLRAGSSATNTKSEASCFSCFACFSFNGCQQCPTCCSCSSCCSCFSCSSCSSCASSLFSCNFCRCHCCRSH